MHDIANDKIVSEIENLLQKARNHVATEVNNTLLSTYMEIGKLLVENELSFENEEKSLRALSKELTQKFGKGFSK